MEVWIAGFPRSTNRVEVEVALRPELNRFGVLAFTVTKYKDKNFAFVTLPCEDIGKTFLRYYAMYPGSLKYKGRPLVVKRSSRPAQPDPLLIQSLQEANERLRSKPERAIMTSGSTGMFPINTFMTGVWAYDGPNLVLDQKYTDQRAGTITFGRSTIVIYLQEVADAQSNYPIRLDIHHSIIDHTVASNHNHKDTMVTFTLNSPPRIYDIKDADSLQHYGATSVPTLPLDLSLSALSMQKKTALERQCQIHPFYPVSSSMCLVYRFSLSNPKDVDNVWRCIKNASATIYKTTEPSTNTQSFETEYRDLCDELKIRGEAVALPFAIKYQLLALVLGTIITPSTAISLTNDILTMAIRYGSDEMAQALRKFGSLQAVPGPASSATEHSVPSILKKIESILKDHEEEGSVLMDSVINKKQRDSLAVTYKCIVTPTGLSLRGPDAGTSNRIFRKYAQYHDYFLQVEFADEDGLPITFDRRASQTSVYKRFKQIFQEGILIAWRRFEFLGFSHASLRTHTVWFMAPFEYEGNTLRARDIIKDLGDFSHLQCAAKCAARIGQAFSSTLFAVHLPQGVEVNENIPDVERNGHCFSDGCGTISQALLQHVWDKLPLERRKQKPTILQIRYRGAKGLVSLDSSLTGMQMRIRKSMTKYQAAVGWRDLELCGASYKPLAMYLGHQPIKILEDLGVPAEHFVEIQDEAIARLKALLADQVNTAYFLEHVKVGNSARLPALLHLLTDVGLSYLTDRFLTDVVEIAALSEVRTIKYRARIPLQAEQGLLLYGIMDETNTLKEGEVYVATRTVNRYGEYKRTVIVQDYVAVTRAPALHPGDIQVVRAVDSDNPILTALSNCIVFSQQGQRDLPSQLSGGDLDGDLFNIILDLRLIPPYTTPPADYLPTPPKNLGRPVETNDVIDFFIEFLHSDRLGQISNAHKVRADATADGTLDPGCVTLAAMASDAVDFSKSGNPVDISQMPRGFSGVKPDFMSAIPNLVLENSTLTISELEDQDDPSTDAINIIDPEIFKMKYYRSNKVLGTLYRRIDERTFLNTFKSTIHAARHPIPTPPPPSLLDNLDAYITRETAGWEWQHHRAFAEQLREAYCENMLDIMSSYRPYRGQPLTELEVFAGSLLGKKARDMSRHLREKNTQVRERFNRDVGAVVWEIVHGEGGEEEEGEALPRAVACVKVAREREGWEKYGALRSFGYVAVAVCLERLWMEGGCRPLRAL
ncbi:rna-dependent rna polymeras-like protein [Polyplosphaeria fusca]|uniref:RNA-dependent RNA polymerase n=1 Tax=Polyplosphaeria fusca TaxID=682080 RepID=A0A9P4QPC0_9PLEO|nr:rna-dependent rna polymeras-like protein [Polyplosphaeria fusca]